MTTAESIKLIIGLIAGIAVFAFIGCLAFDKCYNAESAIISAILFSVCLIAVIFCALCIMALIAIICMIFCGGVSG